MLFIAMATQAAFAQKSAKKVFSEASPTIVMLGAFDENGKALGLGSGFVINKDGLMISNYHVVKYAHAAMARTQKGEDYEVAGVVAFDPRLDYVVLQLKSAGKLPAIRFGNSDKVEIGDEVLAIGHPKGLGYTISTGIISQIRNVDGVKIFQHTAPISPGNSGGPLLNSKGEVIGINTLTAANGQNLNFAIPIDYVKPALENGTRVKNTLDEIARWQIEDDLHRFFGWHQDPQRLFAILYPKTWQVERSGGWIQDGKIYYQSTMLAPEEAYRSGGNGYLPAGIRISYETPKSGLEFTEESTGQYRENFATSVVASNPGLTLTKASSIILAGQEAKLYAFVKPARNTPEIEEVIFLVTANKYRRVVIALVNPSQWRGYDFYCGEIIKSFKLGY
jgi:S1-C subfamily serine protease